jgi:hypothetical protein
MSTQTIDVVPLGYFFQPPLVNNPAIPPHRHLGISAKYQNKIIPCSAVAPGSAGLYTAQMAELYVMLQAAIKEGLTIQLSGNYFSPGTYGGQGAVYPSPPFSFSNITIEGYSWDINWF